MALSDKSLRPGGLSAQIDDVSFPVAIYKNVERTVLKGLVILIKCVYPLQTTTRAPPAPLARARRIWNTEITIGYGESNEQGRPSKAALSHTSNQLSALQKVKVITRSLDDHLPGS